MEKEIERKFLVKQMPDVTGIKPIHYERYFLQRNGTTEERVQKKGDFFEREKKTIVSPVESHKERELISETEFELLKQRASAALIRDSYLLTVEPELSIKVYDGAYKGLIRAEVEFENLEALEAFVPPEWMGKEITNSPLGRDSTLLDLNEHEFQTLLKELS